MYDLTSKVHNLIQSLLISYSLPSNFYEKSCENYSRLKSQQLGIRLVSGFISTSKFMITLALNHSD